MDNKNLMLRQESLFQKIKSFFMKIFRKQKMVEESNTTEIFEENNRIEKQKTFLDDIKVAEDTEKLKILKLQRDYEAGLIKEEEMTDDQISKVEKMYEEQIMKLRNDYDGYKHRMINVRKKLATNKA